MKKFVVLYYTPSGGLEKMQTSDPETMQAEMQKWMEWFKKAGDNLVEMGEMFAGNAGLSADGWGDVHEGAPTGYSVIQAESLDGAKDMLADHPHVPWYDGCRIEVFEPMEMEHNQ